MIKKKLRRNSKKNITKTNLSKKCKHMSGGGKIYLQDNEEHTYEIEVKATEISETIQALLPEVEDEDEMFESSTTPIPLPAVPVDLFQPLIMYMKDRYELKGDEQAQELLDQKFVNECSLLGDDKLFELINAANYLAIHILLDCACEKVASYIKECRTPQELRDRFNITNDFTPEEEEKIKAENAWAFQE